MEAKQRTCLKCNRPFKSWGPGNRICKRCNQLNARLPRYTEEQLQKQRGEAAYPIVGVIYNVLLKTRLQQRAGETEAEFEARRAELAAKNKSGKSTAKRQLPETDEEFQARLAEWYARPEAFHREHIFLSEDRLAMLQDEVWEITQQYLDARRRGKWLLNTSNCFSFQRPCEYLAFCQSGFNPNVRDNLFEIVPPHEELVAADAEAPVF